LIWPHNFHQTRTGEVYHDDFMQQSSMAKKDVPLQKEAYVWLMRDGASTHFSAAERIFLNDAYPDRDGCIV
jgi:hypothetical protein